MTEYRLFGAHPLFRPMIEATIGRLAARYPSAALKAVTVYQPPDGDISLADTDNEGIHLNAWWFARDPEMLALAIRELQATPIPGVHQPSAGDPVLSWHVPGEEPARLLTHEFGHAIEMKHPACRSWARERWELATRDSTFAPSGYALSDPKEFWAEAFCEMEMGAAPPERAAAVQELLASLA